MLLIELPENCSTMNVASTESGIEKKTATVARMLPRKIRIITPVSNSPNAAFVQQRGDRRLYELRLIENNVTLQCRRNIEQMLDGFPRAGHQLDGV